MKTNIIFFVVFTVTLFNNAYSQIVSDTITFDNQSDFTNFFLNSASTGLIQDSINGINNSRVIVTQNEISDRAIYCSKFKNSLDTVNKTSICFKYNSSLVNPNANNPAAIISLHPDSDWNHYIGTFIRQNSRLEIYCHSWASANDTTITTNLVDDHWYKLQLSTKNVGGNFGDQIEILTEVFDLGLTGSETPNLINSILKTNYFDNVFAQDLDVEITFSGSKWGGVNYMDDFKFDCIKNSNSCNFLSLNKPLEYDKFYFSIYPNPTNSIFNIVSNISEEYSLIVSDIQGQIILKKNINEPNFQINLKSKCVFLLSISDDKNNILEKRRLIIE